MKSSGAILVAILLSGEFSSAAVVSWGPVGTGIQASDLIETGEPFAAFNAGTNSLSTRTIGDNVFRNSGFQRATAGMHRTTGDFGFYDPLTGNPSLDEIMDSHTYTIGGSPSQGVWLLNGLTAGRTYQAQFVAAGDTRGCCLGRGQTIFDLDGNESEVITRGGGDWVVGTFVADSETQEFRVVGPSDPALSAVVVRDLGVIPEPGSTTLICISLAGFVLRRRRKVMIS